MDRRQIAVKLVMDTLGLECSVETFADRLVFQKAIYLVQVGGVDLGYHFQWHLKGPYSRSLAGDAAKMWFRSLRCSGRRFYHS